MLVNKNSLSRRSFIQHASAAFVLPVVGLQLIGCGSNRLLAHSPNESDKTTPPSWSTRIVSDQEPGEPLIVAGTIYSPDGRTPLEGITLYVYQTDATGRYSTSGGDNRNTRIHGQMKTNTQGRYEFRTIRPASYPGTKNPAHIHAFVSGPGYPEYWIDEYHFDDDALVTNEMRQRASNLTGTFSPIIKTTKGSDGILRATRDIKIERCTNNCTGH
jgi:protocatechuate 3,4-dioxygenase beta subunit